MRHSRNSKNYSVLRDWLISQRVDAGYTIRSLAAKLEVSHSVVGKIEDGTRKIELFEFISYCQAVGVDPHDGLDVLLKSQEDKPYSLSSLKSP